MTSLDLQKCRQKLPIFSCKKCNYECSKICDWNRHIITRKHLKASADLQMDFQENSQFACECGKKYKHRQSLYKHKRECEHSFDNTLEDSLENTLEIKNSEEGDNNNVVTSIPEKNKISNETVVELIKENKELRQMLMEQNHKIIEIAKEGKYITNNTTNNTTNNFNLNFFLNEQCKDAVNIMDFVSSLHLQMKDLELTGKLGYVEGISKIFIQGIKDMELHKRPIHCSDLKRETLYIKDQNAWEKEDKDKSRIKKAIQIIGSKNLQQIPVWIEQNPRCKDTNSTKNDEYMMLISNTMIGSTPEEQIDNMNKVIKNVSKEVFIDKSI